MFGLATRKPSPRQAKAQATAAKDGDFPAVGRRVRTLPKGLLGVVRWMGPTHFSAGVWVGVELDMREGRNDGEVQGTRYFTCKAGHGVFVRPDNVSSVKGESSTMGASPRSTVATPNSTGAPSSSTPSRDRRSPIPGPPDGTPLAPKGSHASLASENFAPAAVPSSAWGAGSEAAGTRKASNKAKRAVGGGGGGGDDQIIGRILASEAFSRLLSTAVAERVRTEVALKEAQMKADSQAILTRMSEVEQMVDDAGGAMDDIASMVQAISERVDGRPAEPDLRDAAAGGGGSGDAGGGGRDDARVAELTKLLCTVHNMSSQAAELLRTERKQNQVQVQRLTERVQELELRQRDSTVSPTPMEG